MNDANDTDSAASTANTSRKTTAETIKTALAASNNPLLTKRMKQIVQLVSELPDSKIDAASKIQYISDIVDAFIKQHASTFFFDDSHYCLFSYFRWEDTKQGHKYWSELHDILWQVPTYKKPYIEYYKPVTGSSLFTPRMQHILQMIPTLPDTELDITSKRQYVLDLSDIFVNLASQKLHTNDSLYVLFSYFSFSATAQGHSYWFKLHTLLWDIPEYRQPFTKSYSGDLGALGAKYND